MVVVVDDDEVDAGWEGVCVVLVSDEDDEREKDVDAAEEEEDGAETNGVVRTVVGRVTRADDERLGLSALSLGGGGDAIGLFSMIALERMEGETQAGGDGVRIIALVSDNDEVDANDEEDANEENDEEDEDEDEDEEDDENEDEDEDEDDDKAAHT